MVKKNSDKSQWYKECFKAAKSMFLNWNLQKKFKYQHKLPQKKQVKNPIFLLCDDIIGSHFLFLLKLYNCSKDNHLRISGENFIRFGQGHGKKQLLCSCFFLTQWYIGVTRSRCTFSAIFCHCVTKNSLWVSHI